MNGKTIVEKISDFIALHQMDYYSQPMTRNSSAKCKFLNTLLSVVFLTHRLPRSHREYDAVISACLDVSVSHYYPE